MYQASLLACDEPSIDATFTGWERRELGHGAWLDVAPGWVSGADTLFDTLVATTPFKAHRRTMWDSMVDEPRLSTRGWADPPALLGAMADALGAHYGLDLSAVSANLYRDGSDSVAWHGDIASRYRASTVVAIVSLGSARRFLIRPRGGGRSWRFVPAHGDLLVMGGACQHAFEHAVPKTARSGPRISVMFREPGVF